MSDIKVELEIKNIKGIHARAAAAFVKMAERFNCEINVSRAGQTVGGCSIMGLMMLAASKGTSIEIEAYGDEAEKAIEAITELVENKFGEE